MGIERKTSPTWANLLMVRIRGPSFQWKKSQIRGFTLVELIVGIGIILALMALIAPAILQAREAARRMQCRNNLKQLVLAIHNFHDRAQALPPLEIADSWASWPVFVLPDLEQSTLYSNWDLHRRYYVQSSDAGKDLPTFHCPSRPFHRKLETGTAALFAGGLRQGPPGWSDYGVCGGTDRTFSNGAMVRAIDVTTSLESTQPGSGLSSQPQQLHPGWRLSLSFRDLQVDGLTNTILLGEMHIHNPALQDSLFNGDNRHGYARILGGKPTDPTRYPLVDNYRYSGTDWSLRFGSMHPGICQFSMADGSVRAISVYTDLKILDCLARRGDSQVATLP